MKKILLILFCILLATGCTSRNASVVENMAKESLMMIVDETVEYKIYVHKETKVMYICVDGSGMSAVVMVDQAGKPLLYGEE